MTKRTKYLITPVLILSLCAGFLWTSALAEPAEQTTQTQTQTEDIATTTTTTTVPDLSWINEVLRHVDNVNNPKPQAQSQPQPRASTPANFDPGDGSRWDQLAKCECGGNWGCNTGNGFGGGLQFMHQSSYSTWLSFGGGEFAPHPWEATREQQIVIAEKVLARSGWGAWPGCSRKFGWL